MNSNELIEKIVTIDNLVHELVSEQDKFSYIFGIMMEQYNYVGSKWVFTDKYREKNDRVLANIAMDYFSSVSPLLEKLKSEIVDLSDNQNKFISK